MISTERLTRIVSLLVILVWFTVVHGQENAMNEITNDIVDAVEAAGVTNIAVIDFTDLQGNITKLGIHLSDEVSRRLAGEIDRGFDLMDRSDFRAVLAAKNISMISALNPANLKIISGITDLDALISGSITPLDTSIRLTVKIIDADTATTLSASRGYLELSDGMRAMLEADGPAQSISPAGNVSEIERQSSAPLTSLVDVVKGEIILVSHLLVPIKSSPDPFSIDVATAPRAARLSWTEETGEWYEVIYNGDKGYVYKEYIDNVIVKPLEDAVSEERDNELSSTVQAPATGGRQPQGPGVSELGTDGKGDIAVSSTGAVEPALDQSDVEHKSDFETFEEKSTSAGNVSIPTVVTTAPTSMDPKYETTPAVAEESEHSSNVDQGSQLDERNISDQIEIMIQLAENQLESYKLTTPKDDNALETYRAVLALDSGNQDAVQGFKKIAVQYHKLASNAFRSGKKSQAAKFVATGLTVDPDNKDLKKLDTLLKEADFAGPSPVSSSSSGDYETALKYFYGRENNSIDNKNAFNYFFRAANGGHAESAFYVGYMYANGTGTQKSIHKAAEWFRRASKRGSLHGKYYWGLSLIHSFGVNENIVLGGETIEAVADLQYHKAYKVLSELYKEGVGVEKSHRRSILWSLKYTGKELGLFSRDIALGERTRILWVPELERYYFPELSVSQ